MVTIQDQKLLETNMAEAGVSRFRHTLNKMKEKGLESATKHGRVIITTHLEPVAEGIREIQNTSSNNRNIAKKKLQDIDADEAAYLAMISLVDSLTSRCSVLKLATKIASRIEDQIRLQLWVEQEGQVARNIIRKANEKTRTGRVQKRHGLNHKMNKDGFQFQEWTNPERIQVGTKIIDIVIVRTGLVEMKSFKSSKNKFTNYIIPIPKTLDWIQSFNSVAEIARPRYAPTIVPPKKWTKVWGGGYYANIINDLPLVRVH